MIKTVKQAWYIATQTTSELKKGGATRFLRRWRGRRGVLRGDWGPFRECGRPKVGAVRLMACAKANRSALW